MKYLEPYDSINEGKEVELEKEQQKQALIRENIDKVKKNMSKLEASNRIEADKMIERGKMKSTLSKFYTELGRSMQKESMLMQQVGQQMKKA